MALLTYRSVQHDAQGARITPTLRTSIWLLKDGDWQLRYHQRTPTQNISKLLADHANRDALQTTP